MKEKKVLEYIYFGGLLIVIIGIFIIYQKIGNKDQSNDASQVNLADIQERLELLRMLKKISKS